MQAKNKLQIEQTFVLYVCNSPLSGSEVRYSGALSQYLQSAFIDALIKHITLKRDYMQILAQIHLAFYYIHMQFGDLE